MVALDWKYSKRERRKRSEFFLTLEYRFHWIDSKTDCKIFTINNLEVATIKKRFKVYIQFNSVTQSCLTLCDSMDCSTPAFPIHQQLLGLSQTHVHWVSDAVQPSHPLSSLSPPTFTFAASRSFQMSQFFTSGGQRIQLQHQFFQWIFRTDFL